MIASQLELVWYRRKTFWIAVVGFGFVVPLLFSLLPLLVGVPEEQLGGASLAAVRWAGAVGIIQLFGGLIGIVLGASMGAIDHQSGMSRYIALTGTSRPAHALGRLAGAIATWVALVLVATLVALAVMLAVNGWSSEIEHPFRDWLLGMLPGLTSVAIGFGLARAFGSTGYAIAATLGLTLVEFFIRALPKVGEYWSEISLAVAREEFVARAGYRGQQSSGPDYLQALPQSIALILAWTLVPVAIGLLVDLRRDL